jgi:hypothetical protein
MKGINSGKGTFWEWIIAFSLLAVAVAITEVVGFSPKWRHAFVYTEIVFTSVILALQPIWRYRVLWLGLALVFLVHVSILMLATLALPVASRGIEGALLVLSAMAEALLIGSILWRSTHRWHSCRSKLQTRKSRSADFLGRK